MTRHVIDGQKIDTGRRHSGAWYAVPDRYADEDGPYAIGDTEEEAIAECIDLIAELDAQEAARKAKHAAAMAKRAQAGAA